MNAKLATDVVTCAVAECGKPGTKRCSRCGQEAYCSADCQRKAWRTHKLVCQTLDSPENEIDGLLRQGRLYSAQEKLRQLEKRTPHLEAALEERIKIGIHSEIVCSSIRLQDVDGCGQGYVAVRDISAGEALLFDTAFAWAPIAGDKEFHFIVAEKALRKGRSTARRTSARADAQADFYHDIVLTLPMKGGMERSSLDAILDAEMQDQVLLCSIAEGCCLRCSEEPGYMALFTAAARFNHSCAPNASLESTRNVAIVQANTDIPEGVEVRISYLPHELLSDVVSCRERLQAGRGFTCACARCTAEGLLGDSS